jgi:hypothetical protein
MTNLPAFFKDDSETFKVEEVIDYFLSWTIRCADVEFKENELINEYSKLILSKLLFDDEKMLNSETVSNVKTWKQWNNVDVWVHLEIGNKKYAMIIENKMYSSIREKQLSNYIEIADRFYADKPEFNKKFILIRPDYDHDKKYNEKERCMNEGYSYFNLSELRDLLQNGKTGNALFDEFWFNWEDKLNTIPQQTNQAS